MYFYIYDDFLSVPKYQAELARIENELSLLEIKGPISKLHTLTRINEIVKRAVIRGATTLIAVGNDSTLLKVINCLPDKKIAVGLITLGDQLNLANLLNIQDTKDSIKAIAARKLVTLSVGRINKMTFLEYAHITASGFTAVMDDSLTIKASYPRATLNIINPQLTRDPKAKPLLELSLHPAKNSFIQLKKRGREISRFNFKKMVIKSQKPLKIIIDNTQTIETNIANVTTVANAVKLIVGKERPKDSKKTNW